MPVGTPLQESQTGTQATKAPQSKPSEQQAGPVLFHFAECTNCRHILPLATTTEKYFVVLSKDPDKPQGLGEKCMRCGSDSWVLAKNRG